MRWSGSIKLDNGFRVRVVAVQGSELTASISKEHQEMFGFTSSDLLQHLLLGVSVHHARKDAVLDGVQEDSTVGLRCWLLVETRTCWCDIELAWVLSRCGWRVQLMYRAGFIQRKNLQHVLPL